MIGSFTTRSFRAGLAGLALLGAGALTATSAGQSGGFSRAFHPEVTPRDMVVFHDYLDLDDEQRFVIEVLIEEYGQGVREAVEGMREAMTRSVENVEGDDPQRLLETIMEPIQDVQSARDELTREFYEDVQLQLTEDQLEQWPALERKLLRLSAMQRSQLSGEGVDLLNALDRLDLGETMRRTISNFEREYEMELDELLRSREERLGELETGKMRAVTAGNVDRASSLIREEIELRTAIRDHNLEYLELFSSALPSNSAEEFQDYVLSRAYPRVYRRSHVERMFENALELEGLDESVHEAIAQLHSRYLIDLSDVNDRIVRTIQEHEPKELEDRMTRRVDRQAAPRRSLADNPVREQFRERDDMNRQYVNELRNLLTPEQFLELPGASQALAEMRRGQRQGGEERLRRGVEDSVAPRRGMADEEDPSSAPSEDQP